MNPRLGIQLESDSRLLVDQSLYILRVTTKCLSAKWFSTKGLGANLKIQKSVL
jgi:hypothetical protein